MYSKKTSKNGRVLYFKDNKLTSAKAIPEGVAILDRDMTLDEPVHQNATVVSEDLADLEPVSQCIYGDGPADRIRFINQQTIHLCDEHYNTRTTGEIVQQVRESQAADDTIEDNN